MNVHIYMKTSVGHSGSLQGCVLYTPNGPSWVSFREKACENTGGTPDLLHSVGAEGDGGGEEWGLCGSLSMSI